MGWAIGIIMECFGCIFAVQGIGAPIFKD